MYPIKFKKIQKKKDGPIHGVLPENVKALNHQLHLRRKLRWKSEGRQPNWLAHWLVRPTVKEEITAIMTGIESKSPDEDNEEIPECFAEYSSDKEV